MQYAVAPGWRPDLRRSLAALRAGCVVRVGLVLLALLDAGILQFAGLGSHFGDEAPDIAEIAEIPDGGTMATSRPVARAVRLHIEVRDGKLYSRQFISPEGLMDAYHTFVSYLTSGQDWRSDFTWTDSGNCPGGKASRSCAARRTSATTGRSPARERWMPAIVLLDINDGFAGRAPDLGAIESGQPLPDFGPRPVAPQRMP